MSDLPRIGYVCKRYPRYSETFIVTEILAHEEAGLDLEIFSLLPPNDTHFQDTISRVRAPLTYLGSDSVKASELWETITDAANDLPGLWSALSIAAGEDARDVHQAVLLAQAVKKRGIRHLHAHFASSAACVARMAAHIAGVTYSITAHAKDIFHESIIPAELERKLHDAAAVMTISRFNEKFLRERYPDATARLFMIYNGMDLDRLPFQSPVERPPLIVGVGRLVEKKGFHVLVDACAMLRDRQTHFTCRIVGDGDCASALQAQIERLSLSNQVQLIGPRPQGEVFQLIQSAAGFAAPCVVGSDGNQDGLPTVLLESMALGTPCISTDVTGIPEVVRHDETGLLVAQNDPMALADAMERLITDPALRVRLASRGRRLIESDFDTRKNTARQREIFASLLGTIVAAREDL